jgi:hypothetical protein
MSAKLLNPDLHVAEMGKPGGAAGESRGRKVRVEQVGAVFGRRQPLPQHLARAAVDGQRQVLWAAGSARATCSGRVPPGAGIVGKAFAAGDVVGLGHGRVAQTRVDLKATQATGPAGGVEQTPHGVEPAGGGPAAQVSAGTACPQRRRVGRRGAVHEYGQQTERADRGGGEAGS